MECGQYGPTELLVLQATPFCNLSCRYCYLPERDTRHRMALSTVEAACRFVSHAGLVGRELTLVWHAGEPLALPVSYYDDALEVAARSLPASCVATHAVQTNGTLIDAAWCAFFSARGVRVGVSLDGPAWLHDRHRRFRNGRPSHDLVMRGIRRLQDAGIDFHVIVVLSHDSLGEADALVDFLLVNGITRVGFNVEEIEGAHRASTLGGDAAEPAVRKFWRTLARRVDLIEPRLAVREFASLQGVLARGAPAVPACQENVPFAIVAVDWKGGISTFSPELLGTRHAAFDTFVLGHVLDEPRRVMESDVLRRMSVDIRAGREACRASCDYFAVCGGGSPANKLFETGSFRSTETLHCRLTRQALVDAVLDELEARVFVRH